MSAITVNVSNAPEISLLEAAGLVVALGDIQSQVLLGEPGIGKSSTLPMIAQMHGDKWRKPGDYFPEDTYHYVYIDCVTEEINGIKMRVPDHSRAAIREYLSDSLQLSGDNSRPVVMLLDEFNKGPKILQSTWARTLLDRVIGDTPLPAGSKVYCTSNLVSDGLGDTVQGHVGNRVAFHTVRKATATEYAQYLAQTGGHPVAVTFVLANKRCMGSYTNPAEADNELIWNPRRSGSVSYCTPRSISKVSAILHRATALSANQLYSAICGTVGLAAGKLFQAILLMDEAITKTAEVIASPLSVPVPEDFTAQIMMMVRGATDVETQDDTVAFMKFVNRVPSEEVQSVFFHQIVADPAKVALVRGNAAIKEWRMKNAELLV
jgi:hypothetical protein